MGILGFKVALCIAYLRILQASRDTVYKIMTYLVLLTCITGHLVAVSLLIFQCNPITKFWNPLAPGTACIANDDLFYGTSFMSIAFDFIIFLLPIKMLLEMNIQRKRKTILCGMFLLGMGTTVFSILRATKIPILSRNGDSTMLVFWGVVELNTGIILTCAPPLVPLLPCFKVQVSTITRISTPTTYRLSCATPDHRFSASARRKSTEDVRQYRQGRQSPIAMDDRQSSLPSPSSSAMDKWIDSIGQEEKGIKSTTDRVYKHRNNDSDTSQLLKGNQTCKESKV